MNFQEGNEKTSSLFEKFDAGSIIAEYENVEFRTSENQKKLADILKRDPSEKNFSDVYSIVQRLLEAERKDENVSAGGRPDNPYIRFVVGQIGNGAVGLEVGCAQGRLTEYLVGQGHYIVGIDSSRDAIAAAQARSKDTKWGEKCDFFVRDARNLKDFKKEGFDFAISTEVIEHLGLPGFILHMDQLKRILKKEGKYFVTCPSALIYGTEGDLHIRMYYFRELRHLARIMGFNIKYIANFRNKKIFSVPSFFNPLISMYEWILLKSRLNYILNYFDVYFLCLPMSVVFTKKDASDEAKRAWKTALNKKGFYKY